MIPGQVKAGAPSLGALAADLRRGRRSPRKVAARALEQASEEGSAGAWIALADPEALDREAARLEAEGPAGKPLYGLPFAIKDNIDAAGFQTTAGCPGFAYLPRADAPVVERLRRAGALAIGKTNLDQFATGLTGMRSPYGMPRCAFDDRYVPGGSSSGSAVAVALGTVAFALGTDTAGSGRVPAALNGIVGLKPSTGLIETEGVVPACRSLDCVSVFARDADGAARVLAAAAAPGAPQGRGRPLGRALRIAVPRADGLDLDPRCGEAWDAAVESATDLGLELVEIDPEPLLEAATLLYDGPWVAERYEAVGEFIERRREAVNEVVAEIILGGRRYSRGDRAAGEQRLARLTARAAAIWRGADALLMPTIPGPLTPAQAAADPVGASARLGSYTNFVNLMGLAAVAVPAGLDERGMSFGVTLLAPAGADDLLLGLARRWPSRGGHIDERVDLAVCGAHMEGLELNHRLVSLGAIKLATASTAPVYRLVALPGGPPARPGLIRVGEDGAAIELEVWRMDPAAAGRLLNEVPPPLALGSVELADGSTVRGFVCEGHAAADAHDISSFGGWRNYLAAAVAGA